MTGLFFVLFAALAPVAIALWYIYEKDSEQPEPKKWLFKAFGCGVLSAFLSLLFVNIIELVAGFEVRVEGFRSILDAFTNAFFGAAIPEECAKLAMLWLVLRRNPHFDERFDGIVYAVCVGMGFAGIENVMYLFQGIQDGTWLQIGIVRALSAIPGHFFFAVLMGYYFSLYYFNIDRSSRTKTMILAAPILAHGIYDGILMSREINSFIAMIGMIVFIVFLNKLRKKAAERINSLRGM